MARKKLSAKERRQREAQKRAAYIRAEYYKNVDALDYLRSFGKVPTIKTPNKITKASLKAIRKIYKEVRRSIPKTDGYYIDIDSEGVRLLSKLPTKEEMAREVAEEPTQQYRKDRRKLPKTQAKKAPDSDLQYIDDLKQTIMRIEGRAEPRKSMKSFKENVVPLLEEAKTRWIQKIDNAVLKFGAQTVAKTLAENDYMQRIAEMDLRYAFEIIESLDNDESEIFQPLMDAALKDAMKSFEGE